MKGWASRRVSGQIDGWVGVWKARWVEEGVGGWICCYLKLASYTRIRNNTGISLGILVSMIIFSKSLLCNQTRKISGKIGHPLGHTGHWATQRLT